MPLTTAARHGGSFACNASLVFHIAPQKVGTTTFHEFMPQLGYSAVKLTYTPFRGLAYSRHDYELASTQRGGRLLTLLKPYDKYERQEPLGGGRGGLAVSDFPIFGLPCALRLLPPRV